MHKFIKAIIFPVILTLVVGIFPSLAMAESAGYSVQANLPDNQIPGASYFDLRVKPGQKQTISIAVSNISDKPIVISAQIIAASTAENGSINYSKNEAVDKSMKIKLTDIAKLEKDKYEIPAKATTDIPVNIEVPQEAFDGMILGSVRVVKDITAAERETAGTIVNEYAFVTAIKLTENDKKFPAEFTLGSVEASTFNHRAAILVNIINPQPEVYKGAKVNVKIFPKGEAEPIFQHSNEAVDFAPNSIFPFSLVDEAGFGIVGGDYSAAVKVDFGGKTWDFTQEFNIPITEAAQINQSAVNQTQQRQSAGANGGIPQWAFIVAIVVAIIVVALIIFLMIRAKKQKRSKMKLV